MDMVSKRISETERLARLLFPIVKLTHPSTYEESLRFGDGDAEHAQELATIVLRHYTPKPRPQMRKVKR